MYLIVWRYEVEPPREGEFCAAYGPNGEWTRLFETSSAFQGTSLIAL